MHIMICIVICAVLYSTMNGHVSHNAYLHSLCIISRSLSVFLSCCCLYSFSLLFSLRFSALSFPGLSSPHRPLRFNPHLQFPPSARLSANLHHTTHCQREGEMKKREGGREGGTERMMVNKEEERWTEKQRH